MKINYAKYHALGNDFLVIESRNKTISRQKLTRLAQSICARHTGVGADGVVHLRASRKADKKIDIINSDGGWAEKSGNGLRIAAVHLSKSTSRKEFVFETMTSLDMVTLGRKIKKGCMVRAVLGQPDFLTANIPVKTRHKYLINSQIKFGTVNLPVTCLSVGNPHAVLLVEDFEFDWPGIGVELETAKTFPNGTNVEFVRVINRKKISVNDWERGAGATGSSGTGAAAAVCAMVMLGLTERRCEVVFDTGSLFINWFESSNLIELKGPVQKVTEGVFDFT